MALFFYDSLIEHNTRHKDCLNIPAGGATIFPAIMAGHDEQAAASQAAESNPCSKRQGEQHQVVSVGLLNFQAAPSGAAFF